VPPGQIQVVPLKRGEVGVAGVAGLRPACLERRGLGEEEQVLPRRGGLQRPRGRATAEMESQHWSNPTRSTSAGISMVAVTAGAASTTTRMSGNVSLIVLAAEARSSGDTPRQ
jgi:hypothetical protein